MHISKKYVIIKVIIKLYIKKYIELMEGINMGMMMYGTKVLTSFKGYFGAKEECPCCHKTYQKGVCLLSLGKQEFCNNEIVYRQRTCGQNVHVLTIFEQL